MKLLILNPISDIATPGQRYRSVISFVPPVGIAYLAGALIQAGIDVDVEDQFASGNTNEYIADKIRREKYELIGISCLTPSISNIKRLARLIREINLDIKIVLGNIHATVFPEEMLKEATGDIVVRGEGEYVFVEVVKAIGQKKKLEEVKGISFISNGRIVHNPDSYLTEDLDQIPYPAWQTFAFDLYKRYPMLGIYNEIILPIQASRGCTHNCIFCSQNIMYKKPRYRNTEKVLDEIEYMHEKYKIRYFGFNDAYFPFSVEHGLDFCERLMKRGLHKKIRWITETRVNKVNLELLKKMRQAGLRLIMYGFEVGNQSILDSIRKQTTLKQAEDAMSYTRKAGVQSLGLFMLGLPQDTEETCRQTIDFAIRLSPDIAKFNITIPQPGSELYNSCKDSLINAKPEDFTSWSDWISPNGSIIYAPKNITREKLLYLQREAMFRYYINPRHILRLLLKRGFHVKDMYLGAKLIVGKYLKEILKFQSRTRTA
ncbi:MAG: radical SAM protein [Candidatus Omnitrophica bacterium]|nr:radical SAM protein [Candidatus Omnitrophota bacterium]